MNEVKKYVKNIMYFKNLFRYMVCQNISYIEYILYP